MFGELFEKRAGINPDDGLGALASADDDAQAEIDAVLAEGPALYMVDSDRGITNLHVPSDVIIDASMPALIRSSGQGWDAEGGQQDTKCVIPDSSYAALYQETIDHCREHGAFDPATMGTTPNVGLMAQKAEEYGSHDKTFEIEGAGHGARGRPARARPLLEHEVDAGDIWRMCQTKDAPIQDWVRLAVSRAQRDRRARGVLARRDARPRRRAARRRCARRWRSSTPTTSRSRSCRWPRPPASRSSARAAGEDTISVTGNVLRDYLTDLFPILELGTSAKMLSIVPLMDGGGLFETGAGGSAPKHVQQFVKENHLRWDSLGEFLALAVSLEFLAEQDGQRARRRARRDARPRHRQAARGGPLALAQGRRARQPRQPRLPGHLLGGRAGRADRRRRAGGRGRAAGGAPGGRRGADRGGAERRSRASPSRSAATSTRTPTPSSRRCARARR